MADSKHVIDTDRRNTISTADKVAALEHIHYEFQMFVDLSLVAVSGFQPISNAILESWIIHARNINAILIPRKSKIDSDDIKAEHYLISGCLPFLSEEQRTRMNKQVAHLTYERHSELSLKTWSIAEIYLAAWPVVRSMIKQILVWTERHDATDRWVTEFMALQHRGDDAYVCFGKITDVEQ